MVPTPRRDDKPEHLFITRAAWIGFSGAIVAAVITIFPDLRPTGLDRLLERLAELTAAINGEMITIGPGGGIAHAEAAVHPGERVTLKNGDDVPHHVVVPGTQPGADGGGGEAIERTLQPGATLHLNLTTVGVTVIQCLSCTTVDIRITVLLPGESGRVARGDDPPRGGSGKSPPGAPEATAAADTPEPGASAATPPDQPTLTPASADPAPSATAGLGEPVDPEPTADPGGAAPTPTVGGVIGMPTDTPAVPGPPEPTVDPGAIDPPGGPSPIPPQEPAVTLAPRDPEPEEPAEPGAGPRAQVCEGLVRKAPRADIDAAVEDPSSISGWDELRNPNLPEGPDNPRKHWLSMLDFNKPYNRLFNGLRFKAGCP